MTSGKAPSPLEIMSRPDVRAANGSGAAVVVLSGALTEIFWANTPGAALLSLKQPGPQPAAGLKDSSLAMRQIAAAARPVAERGTARILLRSSGRGLAKPVVADLARIAAEADAPDMVLLVAETGRPFDASADNLAHRLLLEAGYADRPAAVFADAGSVASQGELASIAPDDLDSLLDAFRASPEANRSILRNGREMVFAKVSDAHVLVRLESKPTEAVIASDAMDTARDAAERAPETELSDAAADGETPGAPVGAFSVRRRPLSSDRRTMDVNALIHRWHLRQGTIAAGVRDVSGRRNPQHPVDEAPDAAASPEPDTHDGESGESALDASDTDFTDGIHPAEGDAGSADAWTVPPEQAAFEERTPARRRSRWSEEAGQVPAQEPSATAESDDTGDRPVPPDAHEIADGSEAVDAPADGSSPVHASRPQRIRSVWGPTPTAADAADGGKDRVEAEAAIAGMDAGTTEPQPEAAASETVDDRPHEEYPAVEADGVRGDPVSPDEPVDDALQDNSDSSPSRSFSGSSAEPDEIGEAPETGMGSETGMESAGFGEFADETRADGGTSADLAETPAPTAAEAEEAPEAMQAPETSVVSEGEAATDEEGSRPAGASFFSGDAARPDGTTAEPDDAAAAFEPRFGIAPVRFVWQIDRDGGFRSLSAEFAAAVGPRSADVVGRSFQDVAQVYGFDPDGEIMRLLDRRDTWSGRSILWPVEGSDRKVPVDLAALPVYARDRSFDGFRGFGIVRMGEAVADPEAIGLILAGEEPSAPDVEALSEAVEPAGGAVPDAANDHAAPQETAWPILRTIEADSVPATFGRRSEPPAAPSDEAPERAKILPFGERRRPKDGILSQAEEAAFREIGAKLAGRAERAADEADALRSRPNETERDIEARQASADPAANDLLRAEEPEVPADPGEGSRSDSSADAGVADALGDDGEFAGAPELQDGGAREAEAEDVSSAEAGTGGTLVSGAEAFAEAAESGAAARAEGAAASDEALDTAEGTTPSAAKMLGDLDTIFASLPLPVLVQLREDLIYGNREFCDLTGYESVATLNGAGGLAHLFPERDDVSGGELVIRRSNGDLLDVRVHLQRATFDGRSCLIMSFSPLPGAAAAEAPSRAPAPESQDDPVEALREEVEELRTVLNTATDGVVLLDRSGSIRSMNGAAHALFGIAENDYAGRPFVTLFAHESQKATLDYMEMLKGEGLAGILNDGREVIGRVAQGGFIPLFITVGRLGDDRGWCVVIRDIAHWKRIEEDLTNARRQAEAASLHKSQFLANVSHELRTPLNAIIGFADVMSTECFGPIGHERYLEYLGDIKRSGHHVLDLVNDLLDISKIEAGKLDLAFEAVSLNEIVAEVVSLMQPQANRERVIVRSNLPSSVPPVIADRRSIRQIALNLVSNSIRFTPSGGQIIASTSYTAAGDVALRFRDSGIGMTDREIEIALTPFQQVNAAERGRGEGTGLGLPLTKAMVEANRAQFAISSTPGEGTLVEIVFPSQRVVAD